MAEKLAVVGLGYVGLSVAVGLARVFEDVIGFDIKRHRVTALQHQQDETREFTREELAAVKLRYTDDPNALVDRTFFIIAVPTAVDVGHQPDLAPIRTACATVGGVLRQGSVVVLESTVYPGITEEVCGTILAERSGLRVGADFGLGYSPERINPGDREHRLEQITKVVSGSDPAALKRIIAVYSPIVSAGLHIAPSIAVAEAAKVIENTQRDLNIALMNELAIIFERINIRTKDVLDAAATKWNFLRFSPGLVGGHCIGVDPYYLTAKAESVGYHPEVILAGRRINDGMGVVIAQKLIKLLVQRSVAVREARVGILGLAFKEDVPDVRNSRIPSMREELRAFGIDAWVHDPLADPDQAKEEYGIMLADLDEFNELDALVLAVPHKFYRDGVVSCLSAMMRLRGIVIDVKSVIEPASLRKDLIYWSL